MQENDFDRRIVEALRKHPQGLTITEIAEALDAHRHTITKYVYRLEGSGVIIQRVVGPAKMWYLKGGKR